MIGAGNVQYIYFIPAPVNRTSVGAWLYKHPRIARQKYAKILNGRHSLQIKVTFNYEVIHAIMPRKLVGNRACGRVMPRLPKYLVQELNVGMVDGLKWKWN